MDMDFLEDKQLTYAIVLRGNYPEIKELKQYISKNNLTVVHQNWSFDRLWITQQIPPSGSQEGVKSDTE